MLLTGHPKIYQWLSILALFSWLFLAVTHSNCSRSSLRKSNITADSWLSHPALISTLSRAIVQGMRKLIEDLWISEIWFEDMDISVMSSNREILQAKVTDLTLQDKDSGRLFAHWSVHLVSNETLDYTSATGLSFTEKEFKNGKAERFEMSFPPDSLYLDVYQASLGALSQNDGLPSRIHVIYWRELSKKDKVASVSMEINPEGRYSTKP